MSISATNSSLLAGAAGEARNLSASKANLGKEDFLKLLVAQLSHQDPLKPTDGAEFVAELAQFSNLEQAIGTNETLQQIAAMNQASLDNNSYALIGRSVEVDGSVVAYSGLGQTPINFQLLSAASDGAVALYDAAGNKVREWKFGQTEIGAHSVSFDGMAADGRRLPPGQYRVQVEGKDADGRPLNVSLKREGVVTAVEHDRGAVWLSVGGERVAPANVVAVK